jgi:hypothetical protein
MHLKTWKGKAMDKDKERIRPSSKKTCDGNKMQPAAPKTDELDLLDQSQERVLEGLSISVPVQPLRDKSILVAKRWNRN